MKIAPRDTDSFLKKPNPDVVAVLIYGPDEGFVRERAKILGQTVVPDLSDPFNVVDISADTLNQDPARLGDEAASISMMGGRRLIRVREGVDKITTVFKSFLETASGGGNLVILEAGDLGPRSSLRLLFEKSENAAAIACYASDEKDVGRLISDMVRQAGLSLSRDALAFCASRLAGDRAAARGEMEKLILYMHAAPSRQIELEDAIACIGDGAELSLEDIALHAASGQVAPMNRALRRLFSEGIGAIAVLRTAQGHFRRLHLARAFIQEGLRQDEAIKKLQPPVFFKRLPAFEAQLSAWDIAALDRVLDHLCETESQCKRSGMPDETLCAHALLAIAQQARARLRRAAA